MSNYAAGMTIRHLRTLELPQFLRFQAENDYKALPGESEPESLLNSLLKKLWHKNRIATFVAVSPEGTILGYISLVFGKYKKFKGNAYLVGAAVSTQARGQGIGTKLFAFVEKYARERGARRIEFEVFSKNINALRLYERLGYEIEGTKRRAVQNGNDFDDLIFMAKFI